MEDPKSTRSDLPERPQCLDQAYFVWLALGIAMLLFVLLAVVLGAARGDGGGSASTPGRGGVLFLGIGIVMCASNLRKGWRGPRLVLALIAALLLYLAVSTLVTVVIAPPGAVIEPLVVAAMVLVGAAAVAGTVLMFRAPANAYIRTLTRR